MSAPGITDRVPDVVMFNSGNLPNARVCFASAATSGGTATLYATVDGTSTGAAIFSKILHADAQGWVNTATPISVVFTGGKSISSDQRSVSFNVLTGNSIVLGGAPMAVAPNNTQVTAVIWGVP